MVQTQKFNLSGNEGNSFSIFFQKVANYVIINVKNSVFYIQEKLIIK